MPEGQSEPIKIDQEIVGIGVRQDEDEEERQDRFPQSIERPYSLHGTTYKIRPGGDAPAYYVTINYTKEGADYRPLEVFIHSKDMSNFAWVVSLTRMISSIFRFGGDYLFLLDELKTVADPSGPYIAPGRGFVKSIPAHIGRIIEESLIEYGVLAPKEEKAPPKEEGEGQEAKKDPTYTGITCPECQAPSLMRQEGCDECLSCGHSKCG